MNLRSTAAVGFSVNLLGSTTKNLTFSFEASAAVDVAVREEATWRQPREWLDCKCRLRLRHMLRLRLRRAGVLSKLSIFDVC